MLFLASNTGYSRGKKMKKTKNYLLSGVILALFASGVFAVSDNAGTSSGEFLRLPAGAKAAGMGEAYSALANDVYSIYFNAAGLAKIAQPEFLFAHTMYYMDVNHEYLAYAKPFKKGGFGASITYLTTTFEKRSSINDTDTPDSSGNVGDMAVSLAYGQPLCCGINGGVALKFISSSLDSKTASSPAIDLGFQKALTDKIDAGLAITNLAGSLTYTSDSFAVESTMDLGIAEKGLVVEKLTLAVDLKTLLNSSGQTLNFGAEYMINAGKDCMIEPRLGYISENGTVTAGFGICLKKWEVDYAFNTQSDLGTSNRISLMYKF